MHAPSFAWLELAWKTGEMMLASAQVIAHRSARIAVAGPVPSARDRAEFALMGQEKLEAAMECALAIGAHDVSRSMLAAASLWQRMMDIATELAALGASRTPMQAVARHARLMQRIAGSMQEHADFASSAAITAAGALAPLHRRTTANVRRLHRIAA